MDLDAAATLNWPSSTIVGVIPDDPAQVSQDRTIYAEKCASCHGWKLEGEPNCRAKKPDSKLPAPTHDETGHAWHHSNEHPIRITKVGIKPPLAPEGCESDMPVFGKILTDQQIRAVLVFVKDERPPEVRHRHDRRDQGAKQ
ncbi:MAG: c-type cytochrome [Alphaproteobacteria bacterium]